MNMNDTPIEARLGGMTKAQVIEIYRALNHGKVGDTARTGKDEYVKMVLSFPPASIEAVMHQGTALTATANATQAAASRDDAVAQLQNALQALIQAPKAEIDADAVRELVATEIEALHQRTRDENTQLFDHLMQRIEAIKPQTVERVVFVQPNGERREVQGQARPELERMVKLASKGKNILLIGPAGSGKTHLAGQLAEALGREFGSVSCTAGMSESALGGWLLPLGDGGKFVHVPARFVELYENGGVFLLDELDAADPNMLLFINQALANKGFGLPQRHERPWVTRHPEFVCVGSANTFGRGADMQYVGREALDESTLDRFRIGMIHLDYDTKLERALAAAELCDWAIQVRKAIGDHRLRRTLSTRYLIDATDMMEAGDTAEQVKAQFFLGWREDELRAIPEYLRGGAGAQLF